MTFEASEDFLHKHQDLQRGSAEDLRAMGFVVAIHNDYRQNDRNFTSWLLTIKIGGVLRAFKGEGVTDGDALDKIRAQYANVIDDHHHAPACLANHYHGTRAPEGPCSCGAVAHGIKMRRNG